VEVTNGGQSNNFAYVNVLTLTRLGTRTRWTTDSPLPLD